MDERAIRCRKFIHILIHPSRQVRLMIRTIVQRGLHLSLAAGLFCLVGCAEPSPRTVEGKIVFPGAMKLQDTDQLIVTFNADGQNGKTASGQGNPKDGTFTAQVIPGKYKISVAIQPYPGSKDDEKRLKMLDDKLNRAFDPNSTKIEYEVTGDSTQSITVDLATSSVKKN